jgi:hypothetical protein
MRTSTPSQAALCAAFALILSCGGGGQQAGPRLGTPEYSWHNAVEYQDAGDFGKAIESLDNLAAGDSELKNRAILWRAVLQNGIASGYQELAEGYRLAIKEDGKLASTYQNALQQAYRDGRQYSIDFVESLGDLDKALSAPGAALDFPFPGGSAAKPPPFTNLEKGEKLPDAQIATLPDLTLRRGAILSATELAGKGEAANEAQAAFGAGPIALDPDQARLCVAKMLLDRSVLFDKTRLYQPDIRKILVDRAEQWSQPYLESANETLKKRAERLKEEVADERLELLGKRRKLDVRG